MMKRILGDEKSSCGPASLACVTGKSLKYVKRSLVWSHDTGTRISDLRRWLMWNGYIPIYNGGPYEGGIFPKPKIKAERNIVVLNLLIDGEQVGHGVAVDDRGYIYDPMPLSELLHYDQIPASDLMAIIEVHRPIDLIYPFLYPLLAYIIPIGVWGYALYASLGSGT